MMLDKTIKSLVPSYDRDADFVILAVDLQGDTLEPYRFLPCLDHVQRTSLDQIKNSFTLKKTKSRRYLTGTKTDTGDLPLFSTTPTQAKSLWHILQQAAGGIGRCMYTNKADDVCLK